VSILKILILLLSPKNNSVPFDKILQQLIE